MYVCFYLHIRRSREGACAAAAEMRRQILRISAKRSRHKRARVPNARACPNRTMIYVF